jgi:Rrf2 family protein
MRLGTKAPGHLDCSWKQRGPPRASLSASNAHQFSAVSPPDRPTALIQLTKRTEYGLIALIHIADRAGSVVSVREIGDSYPVPRRLLAEVLKDLARGGIVESQRGATGGYVLVALEGAPLVASCEAHGGGGGSTCEVEPVCPIRSPLHRLREGIWRLMERTTLRSLGSTGPLIGLEPHGSVIAPSVQS